METKKITYAVIGVVVVVSALFAFNWYLQKRAAERTIENDLSQTEVISVDNLIAPDQAGNDSVYVERVLLRTDGPGGFVTVHRSADDGGLGDMIGVSRYIEPGVTQNLLISLNEGEKLAIGEEIVLVLHTDDGDKVFDPEKDAVITDAMGEIVSAYITILAEEDLPGFEEKL